MKNSIKIAVAAVAVVGAVAGGLGSASAGAPAGHFGQPARTSAAANAVPHLAGSATPRDLIFVPVTNCRVVSTSVAGGMIAPGTQRNFQIAGTTGFTTQGGTSGGCGVPAYAGAVSAHVISTSATKSGAFVAYPVGVPVGGRGTLYYTAAETDSTGTTLELSSAGAVTVANVAGKAHLIIDVNGYYMPQMSAVLAPSGGFYTSGGYTYASPQAISNIRSSTGSYQVKFDRDLTGCTPIASIFGGAFFASATISGDTVNAGTYTTSGTPINLYWSLTVTC